MFKYDYDDMVADGQIKIAGAKETVRQVENFAVIIKTAMNSVGKFPIDTKDDVERSVYAITHNESIPETVKKTASCYIKLAAVHHGVDFDFHVPKHLPSRIINANTIHSQEIVKEIPAIKIAGERIILDNKENIKHACDQFELYEDSVQTLDAMNIARIIKCASIDHGMNVNDIVNAYSRGHLGSNAETEINLRKIAMIDPEYHQVLDKMAGLTDTASPWVIVDSLKALDKTAEFIPHKYNTAYHKLFMDKETTSHLNVEHINKIASMVDFSANDKDVQSVMELI